MKTALIEDLLILFVLLAAVGYFAWLVYRLAFGGRRD